MTLAGAQQTTQRLYQKYQTQRKKNETARTEARALEENQATGPCLTDPTPMYRFPMSTAIIRQS